MKKFLTLFLLGISLWATQVTGTADISGDGSSHALGSSSTTAHWIIIVAAITNSTTTCTTTSFAGCPRVGDSAVSTARGIPITPGSSLFLPQIEPNSDRNYRFDQVYYIAQSGDKLHVIWGN